MTDRYPVDALAPQYDEIAGICMMGKPVILTRDNQELVLMNPVEFRKMMQLVSGIQITNREKKEALTRADNLEKELGAAKAELEKTREELEETREMAAKAAQEPRAQAPAQEEGSSGFFSPASFEDTDAPAEPASADTVSADTASVDTVSVDTASVDTAAGGFADTRQIPAAEAAIEPASASDDFEPVSSDVEPAFGAEAAVEAGIEPVSSDTEPAFEDTAEIEPLPDADIEPAFGDTAEIEPLPDADIEPISDADAEIEAGIEPVSADADRYAPIDMADYPDSFDRKAHFLNAVASSLEKRSHMTLEPVPEGFAIETDSLTKKYSGKAVNSGISLHVPYGAVYALLGMTGSGRSTLVRNLLGLSFPNSGRITLCNATGKQLNDIRELTGSVMDIPFLYEHMSVNQNMIYRAKLLRLKTPKPAIKEALKKFSLFDKKRKKVRTLSAGMKQRLALALAILGNPELLILDEPLKGLDAADIAMFQNAMLDMSAAGSTILITDSCTENVAPIATHYGILSKGEVIRELSARQILENPVDLDTDYLTGGEV